MQTRMQIFHRFGQIFKTAKYLLITQSFPHSPQVFPQEFSTGWKRCGYSLLVHIKRALESEGFSHFFESGVFYYSLIFVQKLGLDRPARAGCPCVPGVAKIVTALKYIVV